MLRRSVASQRKRDALLRKQQHETRPEGRMKILSARKSVNILGGILVGIIVLFVGVMMVQQAQEEAALKRAEAEANSAEQLSRLNDKLMESRATYVELIIGP